MPINTCPYDLLALYKKTKISSRFFIMKYFRQKFVCGSNFLVVWECACLRHMQYMGTFCGAEHHYTTHRVAPHSHDYLPISFLSSVEEIKNIIEIFHYEVFSSKVCLWVKFFLKVIVWKCASLRHMQHMGTFGGAEHHLSLIHI